MSELPTEPDAGTSTSWGTHAMAAGVVLAGVALGRGSKTGLAAGVLAAAGLRLLVKHSAQARQPHLIQVTLPLNGTPGQEILPEPAASPKDWIDSTAVCQTNTTDLEDALAPEEELLAATDPTPVELFDAETETPHTFPVVLAERDFDFPLGPMIWEQGNGPLSYSDASGETVWYGLRDTVEAPPEIQTAEPDTTEHAVDEDKQFFIPDLEQLSPSEDEVALIENAQPEVGPSLELLHPTTSPETPIAEEPPLLNKLSAFLITDDSAVDEPSAFIAESLTPSSTPESSVEKPSSAEIQDVSYIVAARPGFGEIIAKPKTRSAIPARRSEGQAPRMIATDRLEDSSPPDLGGNLPLPQMPEAPLASEASRPVISAPAKLHRRVEPMAPMMTASTGKKNHIFITVLAVLAGIAIFTVTVWKDGALLKHLREQEWNQLIPVKATDLPDPNLPLPGQP
jgi:hypothetical protein